MTGRERNNRGFTLIELIVVVAIIGIAMAIATPAILNWLPNYRLRQASGDLLSNLQQAKLEAVKRRMPSVVDFNDPVINGITYSYAVFVDQNADGAFDAGDIVLTTVRWADYSQVLPDTVLGPNNGANVAAMTFNTRGRPNVAGTIFLRTSQGSRREVRVNLVGGVRTVQP